jgi:hypothetical protein
MHHSAPVGSIYSFSALTWSFTWRQRVGTTIGETGGSRLVEVPTSGATAPPLSREAAGQSAHRVFGPNTAFMRAPTALSGVTWDALSNMTTSKQCSTGSTDATTSGLMAQHGLSAVNTCGAC